MKKKLDIQRIAFIYLPTDFSDANRLYEAFQRRPPLGLQYLQAKVHRVGIQSVLLDGILEPLSPEEILRRIRGKFHLAGFYVSSMNRNRVSRTIRYLREHLEIPILAGGPGSTHAESLLHAGADAVCLGEGEETLMEIIDSLRDGRGLSTILGTACLENGQMVETHPRPLIEDLNALSFPHRDPGTVSEYYDYFNPMVRKPCITLTASRGCYYRCSFCFSHRFWRGRYRLRSAENVLEEVRTTHRNFSARYLLFVDDVFPQKLAWVDEFLDGWKREDIRIPWMCILNPNSYRKTRDVTFRKFRDAGCNMISFGAQSAVPQILRNVHRRPDEACQLLAAVKTANRLGMVTVVTYIFGLPGETEKTAQATARQLLNLNVHLMDAHVLEVLPGSEIEIEFPGEAVTDLPEKRLEEIRRRAFRKFYLNPRNVLRLLWTITKKNPEWFFLFPLRPVWAALRRGKGDAGNGKPHPGISSREQPWNHA